MDEEEELGEELGEEEDITPEALFLEFPPVVPEKAPQPQEDVKADDRKSFSESILGETCRLRKPEDNVIGPIFKCYYPSKRTHKLASERYRSIFSEAFCTDDRQRVDERGIKYTVPKLVSLCLDKVASLYKSGNYSVLKVAELREQFGKRLDINLPLVDIIHLDITSFWQKVFFEMCPDKLFISKMKKSPNGNWKALGIQEKFRDLIENSKYEEWHEMEMRKLAKCISEYITTLIIKHLKPLEAFSVDKDPHLADFKIYKTPFEDCHHINLDIVGELKNLTHFHIEFQAPWVGWQYDSRFFEFSYRDMENLARGLEEISQLKKFTLRRSILNNKKLIILTKVLSKFEKLESLDFSYCDLKDDCGWTLTLFLEEQTRLKSLELAGNALGTLGIYSLMFGVQNYQGSLEYLGLARNPILAEGVTAVARALNNSEQVTHLNLTGIIVSEFGAGLVAEFVKYATNLTKLEMCALPLGEEGGNRLIQSLQKNEIILELECYGCDLTPNQQFDVYLLLKRNNYIKMTAPVTSVIAKTPEERIKLNEELNKWVNAPKHSVFLKAQEIFKKEKECKDVEVEEKVDELPSNIPIFIPKAACTEISNRELLLGEYYEEHEGYLLFNLHTFPVLLIAYAYIIQKYSYTYL